VIDIEKVLAICLVLLAGGVLVLSTHLVTMRSVTDDLESWRDLAASSQAAAAQCVTVLEGVDAALLGMRNP
jgi:uncharacterized membrane protein|tara:strand:+ start:833 stop:1045 length:213 start_codon:yes stop_codon:yes gene_type:complete